MNPAAPRRQRGSIVVMGAAGLAVATACLMVLDVAHVFTVKRELQKVADLAALAGARLPGDCDAMRARGTASALANGHATGTDRQLAQDCGTWAQGPGFAASATEATALRVTATRQVPYFFMVGDGREVQAQAVARNHAYDVFSIGTGLASIHPAALNALLTATLGTSVNLDLVGYQGLATANVRVADLLAAPAIEVGTVRELLDADLRLADLSLAMAQALSATSPLSASVLDAIAARIPPGLQVRLGQLLDVQLPNVEAAAQARLNVLELLLTSAQLSNGSNLLDLATAVPPNPLASVDLKLRIVEPPQLAIGVEGTTAKSAQVRLLLDARIAKIELPLGLLATSGLHVPLFVEAAPGTATLRRMECASDPADCAVELEVRSGLARACIGSGDLAAPAGTPGCTAPASLLAAQVSVLNVPLADVDLQARAVADLVPAATQTVRFGSGGFAGSAVADSRFQTATSPAAAVGTLLAKLPADLDLDPRVTLLGLDLGGVLGGLLDLLKGAVQDIVDDLAAAVVQPLLASLVEPLLTALGVRVGVADLHQIDLHCGQVELVR